MSWIQDLYETYNNCKSAVGYTSEEKGRPLLPLCHVTSQAHIEIFIDGVGNFLRAQLVTGKGNDAATIIPCTESSASRAGSKPECHPLCDKLQYVAMDFIKHGGSVTSGFAKNPEMPFKNYLCLLTNWCESKYAHPKATSVLKYVKKGTVIEDLITSQILLVGDDGKFLKKEDAKREKNTLDIFSVVNSQDSAFIRWIVEEEGILESKVWKDPTLYDSWINYYLSTKEKAPLCYVTGEDEILTNNHPKYIRRPGDGAKLISSNDTSGFTFRGRFIEDKQACTVGLEVSQKSHYALSWLISRQGYTNGDQVIVAWATSGEAVPKTTDDSFSILGIESLNNDEMPVVATAQELALRLKKRIAGYSQKLGATSKVIVMGFNSATPGRLSITYYRQLTGSDFLKRIDDWHTTGAWFHTYRTIEKRDDRTGKIKRIPFPFIGVPAPRDIAEAAYGKRLDDKLRAATVARILPCIIDGQPVPRDLVESTVRQACNRAGKDPWEWNKMLSIACTLFSKLNKKEKYGMALDPDRKTRDYLYGRLLALADNLEEWALWKAGEKRETNAARLMQRFAERPFSTWRTLELALAPYKARLGGRATKRLRMIDEVIASFRPEDFTSDKRLSGEFLLGYHSQRESLRINTKETKEGDEEIKSEKDDQEEERL